MRARQPRYLPLFHGLRTASAGLTSLALFLFLGAVRVQAAPANILVLGDSISAAYGMSLQEGWVSLLGSRLQSEYAQYRVVNASISGETSAGAASRLPALLTEHQPAIVIIELGGNDGLRGYPIKRFRANLRSMTAASIKASAQVLILGMEIPPNYGTRYTTSFRDSYKQVSAEFQAALLPFMLDGVATNTQLMQADGIHPTAAAQHLLLNNVWPTLEPLLKSNKS